MVNQRKAAGGASSSSPCRAPEILTEELINKICQKIDAKMDEKFDIINEKINKWNENMEGIKKTIENNSTRIDLIEKRIDINEQYSRLNNLRIYGIKESEEENVETLILSLFKNKMDVELLSGDIDKCYRLGEFKENNSRPILVRFVTFKARSEVYINKKKLKKTGFVIREDLTKYRLDLVKKAANKVESKNVWTMNGKVFIMYRKQKKIIECYEDLPA